MRRGLIQVVAAGCLLLAQGTESQSGEHGDAGLPRSFGASAVGFRMQCEPARKVFGAGEKVSVICTIANVSTVTKPLVYQADGGPHSPFCFYPGEKIGGPGGRCFYSVRFPWIETPVGVRSRDDDPRLLAFDLPPGAGLRFRIEPAGEAVFPPGTFRGRFCYSVRRRFGSEGSFRLADAIQARQDGYVHSNVVEFTVAGAERKLPWRIVYGAVGAACAAGLVRVWRSRRSNETGGS